MSSPLVSEAAKLDLSLEERDFINGIVEGFFKV